MQFWSSVSRRPVSICDNDNLRIINNNNNNIRLVHVEAMELWAVGGPHPLFAMGCRQAIDPPVASARHLSAIRIPGSLEREKGSLLVLLAAQG